MEKWQLIYINFAVAGFIFQIILIIGVYFISKFFILEKTDKELLERIYNQQFLSGNKIRNVKF